MKNFLFNQIRLSEIQPFFQDDLAVSDDSEDEDKMQGHQTKQEPPDEDDPMAF